MSKNFRYLYWDRLSREWYDPYNYGVPVFGVDVTPGDVVTFNVAITTGRATVDSSGIPLASYQYSLSDRTNCVLGIKSNAHRELKADYDYATAGFDTSSGSGHNLSAGIFAVSAVVPVSVIDPLAGKYGIEFTIYDTNGNRLTPASSYGDLECVLNIPVNLGTESNPPTNAPKNIFGTATISGTNTSVAVTITGLRSTGAVNIGQLSSTGGFVLWQHALTNDTLTITVPTEPGAGLAFNFSYSVVQLA